MHKYCHLRKEGRGKIIPSKWNRINIVVIFPFYFNISNPPGAVRDNTFSINVPLLS